MATSVGVVRIGTVRDAGSVAALDARVFSGPGLPHFFFVDAPKLFGDKYLVADVDAETHGYVIGYANKSNLSEGHIMSLGVDAAARGLGLGSRLLTECLSRLRLDGCRCVILVVKPTNSVARGLYAKSGFRDISYHSDWFGPGEDRVRMELTF